MKKQEKTNVMRILDQKKIPYENYTYDSEVAISGMEVATTLGQDPNQVFKNHLHQFGYVDHQCLGSTSVK